MEKTKRKRFLKHTLQTILIVAPLSIASNLYFYAGYHDAQNELRAMDLPTPNNPRTPSTLRRDREPPGSPLRLSNAVATQPPSLKGSKSL